MKKVFFSLMLVASLAFAFISCDKNASESDTHSQTFTLGETTYDINNVITIENIQYDGSQIYNAIVLSNGQIIGNGGEGQGVVILFRGDITDGTYTMSFDPEHLDANYPKYFFAELEVEDIVNFNIDDLMQQDEVYVASAGSFTLLTDDGNFIITTDGIEVEKVKDIAVTETSSVDYEGNVARYVLATVEEGNINGANIVTAGVTKFILMMMEFKIIAFITETGDMIGITYSGSSIPTGELNNVSVVYVNAMDTQTTKTAFANVTISVDDNDVYTVDIPQVTFNGTQYNLHYVGTLPFFDFPF